MLIFTRQNAALKENVAIILYKVIDDLLYFDDDKRDLRFCVLIIMKIEVFKLAYDEIKYFDYVYIHKRLIEEFYIFNMITKLHEFIRHYFHCQLNQTSRYKLYDFLQLIFSPVKSFHILIIDFILAFPKSLSDECDCILSVIDKFFKVIIFILGKII